MFQSLAKYPGFFYLYLSIILDAFFNSQVLIFDLVFAFSSAPIQKLIFITSLARIRQTFPIIQNIDLNINFGYGAKVTSSIKIRTP
jgi:hypothetical protein